MCGLCGTNVPEVFRVPEKMIVLEDAKLEKTEDIEEAARKCPVSVIAIEYDHSGKRDNNE